ncbi:DUF3011 domain-containing protein [Acinetobacter haemolyticus]|nr:DUF3011 domain-containing protein [Acinetobacter haemolyticus]AZN68923.1 DUF3011 domain-containing protein [Acinetobacter haemolyticus]MQZ29838.1 DUF3011 domain-containing protein [Acinetobacter haemolyticus]NAR98131.1 DUF3011 domain-containing protein [Acinetobacter haemolyticus]WPO68666.1 DUF3011 domain-containing protein [Acinetobacter haemolyticus]
MKIKNYFYTSLTLILISLSISNHTFAETTVKCESKNFEYNECYAKSLKKPQLIHQSSHASCILNRTWGFNPKSGYLWVSQGCSGVFADPTGYHHGQSGTYDNGARTYSSDGKDLGAAVAGALIGAVILNSIDKHQHQSSNKKASSQYDGCHGVGCKVDNPDKQVIDNRPQFDKDGNPNFDTHGNWIGCHGMGCEVDNPDY